MKKTPIEPRPAPKQTPLCLLKIETAADQRHGLVLIGHDLQRAAAETVTQEKDSRKKAQKTQNGGGGREASSISPFLFFAIFVPFRGYLYFARGWAFS